MGYEDRDYMQSERGGGMSWMPEHPGCRWILLITIAVFVAQLFSTRNPTPQDLQPEIDAVLADQSLRPDEQQFQIETLYQNAKKICVVEEWLQLETSAVLGGQVWRLMTSTFVHHRFGIWHLVINLLLFYWFGRRLEERYGTREFVSFYLLAAILSSLVFVVMQASFGESYVGMGSSSAVFAVVGLYSFHHPDERINLFGIVPITMRYLVLLYAVFDLYPVLLSLTGVRAGVGISNLAHLAGLAFAFSYWQFGWRLQSLFRIPSIATSPGRLSGESRDSGAALERTRRKRPVPAVDKKLEANLDMVLEKISMQGEESLTAAERALLADASRRYRERQQAQEEESH